MPVDPSRLITSSPSFLSGQTSSPLHPAAPQPFHPLNSLLLLSLSVTLHFLLNLPPPSLISTFWTLCVAAINLFSSPNCPPTPRLLLRLHIISLLLKITLVTSPPPRSFLLRFYRPHLPPCVTFSVCRARSRGFISCGQVDPRSGPRIATVNKTLETFSVLFFKDCVKCVFSCADLPIARLITEAQARQIISHHAVSFQSSSLPPIFLFLSLVPPEKVSPCEATWTRQGQQYEIINPGILFLREVSFCPLCLAKAVCGSFV